MEEVIRWCGEGKVGHRNTPGWVDVPVEVLVPTGLRGDVLVRPLTSVNGSLGVLIASALDSASFDGLHVEIMESLLEPFSTVLENDRRLRELATIKAAAEAEKHALLSRLGQTETGEDIVVGADSGLKAVMERVNLVARSDARSSSSERRERARNLLHE